MTESIMVYMTVKDLEEARKISRALVEEKLVACTNISPGIESVFWWKGKIEKGDEVVLVAKTRKDLGEAVIKRVKELHGYETPCIVVLPIEGGNEDFLRWIEEVTKE